MPNLHCAQCQQEFSPLNSVGRLCPACLMALALSKSSLKIDCPYCHSSIEIADENTEQAACKTCGTVFHINTAENVSLLDRPTQALGRFELLQVIGTGGFGTVWKARDTRLDRLVAIKLPKKNHFEDEEEENRFLREGRFAAQLRHPGIVTVLEADRADGQPYIVSDFIRGVTLAEYLKNRRPDFVRTVTWISQVTRALHYSHEMGVIHRDLKPGNIILEMIPASALPHHPELDLHPRLMDFGIAKRNLGESTLTLEGTMLGTPLYMSPEQVRATHSVDVRTDIYAMGVILYEMLTNELPFRGTPQMVIHQILNELPRPPRLINNKIPIDLETITLKCLEKDRNRRYSTAAELADELDRWLNHEPIHARAATQWDRFQSWCRRKPAIATLTIALQLALISGLSGIFWQWRRAETSLQEATVERQRAVRNFHQARKTVDDFLVEVDGRLAGTQGLQPLRKELLQKVIAYYGEFVKENPNDPEIALLLAESYERIGDVAVRLGSSTDALRAYAEAAKIYRREILQSPNPTLGWTLVRIRGKTGPLKHHFGNSQNGLTDVTKALESLARNSATEVEWALLRAPLFIDASKIEADLGNTSRAVQHLHDARSLIRPVMTEKPVNIQLLRLSGQLNLTLGDIHLLRGDPSHALTAHTEAHAQFQNALDLQWDDMDATTGLGLAQMGEGRCQASLNSLVEASSSFDKARTVFMGLARQNPAVSDYTVHHASVLFQQASLLHLQKKNEEAIPLLLESMKLLEPLNDRDPPLYIRRDLASVYHLLGVLQPSQSTRYFSKSEKILEDLLLKNPDRVDCWTRMNLLEADRAVTMRGKNEASQALSLLQKQFSRQASYSPEFIRNQPWRQSLDKILLEWIALLETQGAYGECLSVYRERARLWREDNIQLYEISRSLALMESGFKRQGEASFRLGCRTVADILEQAFRNGFKDRTRFNKDPAFDPIRKEAEILEVLGRL